MQLHLRHLPLLTLFALSIACGDDGVASATAGTTSAGTATEASATDPSASATESSSTTGASGSASESAGSSSSSGDPTTTGETSGPVDGAHCQEACQTDDECEVGGLDLGYTCVEGRCSAGGSGCATNGECVALYSGWAAECASQDECIGQVCVDIGGGVGRCATAPSDLVPCTLLLLEETTYPPIEGGEPVAVCAQTAAICEDGQCAFACTSDTQCTSASAPICNPDTGDCECATDAHCADVPGASICSAGSCRCASDADCEGVDNADVCLEDGSCGCSSAAVCTSDPAFDGTSYVCEAG